VQSPWVRLKRTPSPLLPLLLMRHARESAHGPSCCLEEISLHFHGCPFASANPACPVGIAADPGLGPGRLGGTALRSIQPLQQRHPEGHLPLQLGRHAGWQALRRSRPRGVRRQRWRRTHLPRDRWRHRLDAHYLQRQPRLHREGCLSLRSDPGELHQPRWQPLRVHDHPRPGRSAHRALRLGDPRRSLGLRHLVSPSGNDCAAGLFI
jgi:hypothetical protein